MKAIVLTGFTGRLFSEMAEVTVPLFIQYARLHGAEFECRDLCGPRPPSWMKIPAILAALSAYDAVLWIDIDVVILDKSVSIFDQVVESGAWQCIVEHETECGLVPNCGVWVVTQAMAQTLLDMWNSSEFVDHPWWEQASLISRMGYVVDGPRTSGLNPTELHNKTAFLPSEWNHHPRDERRVGIDLARFVHVTQYEDRVSSIVEFAK